MVQVTSLSSPHVVQPFKAARGGRGTWGRAKALRYIIFLSLRAEGVAISVVGYSLRLLRAGADAPTYPAWAPRNDGRVRALQ